MRTRAGIQFVLGFIATVPLIFIIAGVADQLKLEGLKEKGVIAEGYILGLGELRDAKGVRTHYLEVKFRQNDRVVIRKFPVEKNEFIRASQLETVKITYVPGKSNLSRLGTHFGYNKTPFYIAIAALFFIVIAALATKYYPEKHSGFAS